MQIAIIRKKIIKNIAFTLVFTTFLAGSIFLKIYRQNLLQQRIKDIENEAIKISQQATDIEQKATEAKKYRDVWKTLSNEKKMIMGIKSEKINEIVDIVAEKYHSQIDSIKLSIPQNMQGDSFDYKTVAIVASKVTLFFRVFTDIDAINFLIDLKKSIPNYIVFKTVEIKKEKKYEQEDYLNIAIKKPGGLILCKTEFIIYAYKDKEKEAVTDKNKVNINNPTKTTDNQNPISTQKTEDGTKKENAISPNNKSPNDKSPNDKSISPNENPAKTSNQDGSVDNKLKEKTAENNNKNSQ